jgi:hypothetical protein
MDSDRILHLRGDRRVSVILDPAGAHRAKRIKPCWFGGTHPVSILPLAAVRCVSCGKCSTHSGNLPRTTRLIYDETFCESDPLSSLGRLPRAPASPQDIAGFAFE